MVGSSATRPRASAALSHARTGPGIRRGRLTTSWISSTPSGEVPAPAGHGWAGPGCRRTRGRRRRTPCGIVGIERRPPRWNGRTSSPTRASRPSSPATSTSARYVIRATSRRSGSVPGSSTGSSSKATARAKARGGSSCSGSSLRPMASNSSSVSASDSLTVSGSGRR
jgi:hypothetical protein